MKMDCRQIEELMMDYLYQELDAEQTSAYRTHLTTCASCGAQLAGYERTRLAVRELPDIEPPAEVTARLLQEAARRPVRAVEPVGAAATVGARGVAAASPVGGKSAWAWLSGWMQPIFAHPGFAAAAGVIIVGGIAGLLALRGKLDLSAPRASAPAPVSTSAPASADELNDNLAVPGEPAAAAAAQGSYEANSDTRGLAAGAAASAPLDGRVVQPKDVGSVRLVQPKAGESLGGILDAQPSKDRRRDDPAAGLEEKRADKNLAAPEPPPPPLQRAAGTQKPAERPAPGAPSDAEADFSQAGVGGRGATAKKEALPTAPAPLAHEASRPAKSVAAPKPRAEVAADDSSTEGGVAGGSAAGAGAPAPAAVAPMAPAPSPAPATKGKAAASPQENEAKKLHGQARMKANTGDCASALKLRDRIYRVDPSYFERSVRNDADLGKCTARKKPAQRSDQNEEKMPSPSRDEVPAAGVNSK